MKKGMLLIIFLLVTLPLSAEESLVLGIGEWKPWNSKDLPGNGIASQIVTEAFEAVGIRVEYKYYPWRRAYEMTLSGALDGTFPWSKRKSRLNDFYFSDPIMFDDKVFYYRKEKGFEWETLDDLKGLVIGLQIGSSYSDEFDPFVIDKKIKIAKVKDVFANFNKLPYGQN